VTAPTPKDPDFAARVRSSFEQQALMRTIGARLRRVDPGEVEIEIAWDERLTQQHGYLHAGVVTSVLDSACGYAAYTLMPATSTVLSVEFKVNLLRPAAGVSFVAGGPSLPRRRTCTRWMATLASASDMSRRCLRR
jgi:uncharacterized protein (TIGR00369 family)